MTLNLKVPLAILCSLAISGASAGYIFRTIVLEEFRELEDAQVQRNAGRLEESLNNEMRSLSSLVQDWAIWGDLASYVTTKDQDFETENLSFSGLNPLNISHVMLFDESKSPIFLAQLESESSTLVRLSEDLPRTILSSKIVAEFLAAPRAAQVVEQAPLREGLFIWEDRAYFVAVAKLASVEGEPQREHNSGLLIMTREISAETETRIAQQIKLDVQTEIMRDSIASAPGLLARPQDSTSSGLTIVKPHISKNDELVTASSLVYDIFGREAFRATFSMPREIYSKGLAMQAFLLKALTTISIITALTVILILRRLILRPLHTLSVSLLSIAKSSNFHMRVPDVSRDELGNLGQSINTTLSALEAALARAENAQHQAEAANAAKSSFIAKVSHELRTPIHSITGMLRILLREERSGAKRNYIMMARNAAYGLLETINEILDFSKAEAGKLVLEKISFSIHDVIRESIQTIGPRLEEKGSLEASVQVPHGIPSALRGDPLRLRQVLVNLLGNATKFTKQGSIGLAVSIVERSDERIVLQLKISDTGVGIPEDRIDHIFEPFGQADESVSRMFTGTGLGLTIVRQFVEGMNGTVRVESKLGKGSHFIVTVPFEIDPSAVSVDFKPLLASPRVALIDGESLAVEAFSQELEECGYIPEIFKSEDPLELDTLSRSLNQYGLIIVTSEAMKKSRVFDLVVELRGRESTPVVSILSPFELSVRERLLALEVPFVLTRPISMLDILGVVSGQLTLGNERWEDSEDGILQSARSLEVLVADDAQTNRIILTELLRDAGHNVVCVENGVDMVSLVRDGLEGVPDARRFDIILTDVQMPLLDGLSASTQIRELEKKHNVAKRLPIVAVTAHAMTDETSRMRSFGVDDVVTKPLDPLRLGQVIQRLTGQPTGQDNSSSRQATPSAGITDTQLAELALRLWAKVAKRDTSVAELFGLSDDPVSPEDFQRVLDIADVIERSGNSVRRSLLIFSGFTESYKEQLQKLNEAKQAKSSEDLRFASHALKGLLLDVGARITGKLAGSIEQLCKEGDLASALDSVGLLTKQVLLVSRLISQIGDAAGGEEKNQARDHEAEKKETGAETEH